MVKISPEEERILGTMCSDGIIEEHYDNNSNQLVKTITQKGIKKIREILKEPKYKKYFQENLRKELLSMPIELRKAYLLNLMNRLKGI